MAEGEDRIDINTRIANLSPDKRALLERRLMQHRTEVNTGSEIPRRGGSGPWPLSFAQQRLWFLDQLAPDSRAYNMPKGVRISGPLNLESLQRSLNAIVDRHQVLRTTFTSVDGNPVQAVSEPGSVQMPLLDLSDCPEPEREAEVQRLMEEVTLQPFDLSRDLMLRAALLRVGIADHILLLVTHHIASDGWSSSLLLQELSTLYRAFSAGEPSPLPDLPIQYADFAQWQREWLQGPLLASQLDYWKGQLDGAPPPLELPTDRPRPSVQTYAGERQFFQISPATSQSLRDLSRKESVTLFMTLLASFQTLLHRYCRQDDIIVGTPIAGRTRVETESLIGFFVNTLVLRNDLSGDPGFRELLGRVREVALGAYAHQDLPFEQLVAELRPERDLSRNPLFQVAFALQNTPSANLVADGGLTFTPFEVGKVFSPFDLTLSLQETKQGLSGRLEYNSDIFDPDTMSRLTVHFQTLLESVAADPDQRLSQLSIMPEAELHQLLVEWNTTATDYPRDVSVGGLFEIQSKRVPDAPAMEFGDTRLTYQELNREANQLAHYLGARGIGSENLVGLCMERSPAMVIAILGIVKAGAAYLPLDPSDPLERLEFMIQDSRATAVLTHRGLAGRLPATPLAEIIDLDMHRNEVAAMSGENPANRTHPDDLIYVMSTSGSTGVPKAIGICHRAVVRLVCNTNYINFDESDRVALVSNPAFDAATFEIWGPLLNGACMVGIPQELLLSPSSLARYLSQQRATTIFVTTALFNQLVQSVPSAFKGMRQVLFGGEAADPRWVLEALALDPPERLLHVYGPTENTTFTTWYHVESVSSGATTVPIGRPVANGTVYILDPYLNPVPVGVPGELHLGGDGLARGYLYRPELTAERFIPNPFSSQPGDRLYRTGDLARYLSDGSIEFLSRVDQQVKVRGFRIELGEIETVLSQHPAVRQAVMLVREETPGDKRLVAHLVPEWDQTPRVGQLREFLRQKLPDYMIPSAFVFLDSLPLTSNGKIDRMALPAPDQARPELDNSFAEPDTPMQLMVAQAWREVLQVDRVGLYDNFFDLGGHSLLAMKVIAKLEKSIGLKISPMDIMFQTLGQLAETCETQARVPHPGGSLPLSRRVLSAIRHRIFQRNGSISQEHPKK